MCYVLVLCVIFVLLLLDTLMCREERSYSLIQNMFVRNLLTDGEVACKVKCVKLGSTTTLELSRRHQAIEHEELFY